MSGAPRRLDRQQAGSYKIVCKSVVDGHKKGLASSEAFYFGFNLFNFAASILEKVRT
jgi:hypothetical protein